LFFCNVSKEILLKKRFSFAKMTSGMMTGVDGDVSNDFKCDFRAAYGVGICYMHCKVACSFVKYIMPKHKKKPSGK